MVDCVLTLSSHKCDTTAAFIKEAEKITTAFIEEVEKIERRQCDNMRSSTR
jgi:hypothetical protein